MSLPDEIVRESTSRKGQLCERMLNANLHQLHVAAEDLRATAHTFQKQAAVHAKDEQAAA
jgi:propanediol dehydratase small subunit